MDGDRLGEPDGSTAGDGSDREAVIRRQQAALAARDDVVMVLNEDGSVESVQGELDALLGYDAEAIVGDPVESLLAEGMAPLAPDGTAGPGASGEMGQDTAGTEGATGGQNTTEPSDSDQSSRPQVRQELLSTEATTVEVTLKAEQGPVPVTVSTAPVPDRPETVCIVEPRAQPGEAGTQLDLVETVDDPIFVLDRDWSIDRVNEATVAYTGYERDDLVGRELGELIASQDYQSLVDRVRETVATDSRQTVTTELRLVTSAGTVVLSEAKVSVLTDSRGEYARAVAVLRDVSERKQREQDLELLKQVLSRVFRHNVRNKLNVARGHAQLLQDEPGDDRAAHVEAILETTGRLLDHSEKARLIETVVDTDRTHTVDLTEAVENSLAVVRDEHPDPPVEVDLPETVTVTAHPRIGEAVTELLDNALRHAPPGRETRVQVWVERGDGSVTLCVEDESGGLAEPDIEILREGTESSLEHLSGLGLWLVRWLVDRSNASLLVQRTDQGSLMGIRFGRSRRDRGGFEKSPLTESSRPTERDLARVHGETVVGRVENLHRLEDVYASLERNGGHAVFVTGASGIGKTTLVETFLDRLPDEDVVVGTGRCTADVTPPYEVFREVFDELPETTELVDVFDDAVVFDDDSDAVQQRRAKLFTTVANGLRELAAEQSVVLVLEDLHRADRATAALLEFLIDEVGRWTFPILFLCTVNTDTLDGDHPVERFTAETASDRVQEIPLTQLDRADVRTLLQRMLNIDRVPPAVLDDVYDHTGGNPLFVREVGHDLVKRLGPEPSPDDLLTDRGDHSISATAERAVADRIGALSARDRQTLQMGAVIGRTADIDVLVAASDRAETAVRDSLERLVTRQLWERADGTVAFVHGLVREEALASMDADRRRECHRRAGTAIERVHDDALEQQYGRLGKHYERAGKPDRAVEYYRQAGDRARGAYGHEVAIENYERALALAREHDSLADGELAALLADIAGTAWACGRLTVADDRADEGLAVAPEGSRVRCRLLDISANVQADRGEYDRARELTTAQRTLAETVGARDLEASARRRLGSLARRHSEYDRASDHYEAALDIARELGDRVVEARILKGIGGIAYEQGDFEAANEYATRSLDIVQEVGDRRQEARTLTVLGAIASNRGAYHRAREYYRRSLDIDGQLGDRHAQARTLGNLGVVARREGAYDEAREHYQQSLDIARDLDDRKGEAYSLHNIGEVEVYRGACRSAREHLRESLEMVREFGDTRVEVANLVRLGDCERVARNLDAAADYYREALDIASDGGLSRWMANSYRGLGAVARCREEYDRAREQLDVALSEHEDIDNRSGVGEVRVEHGRLALARSDLDRAERQARLARDILADLNADHWLGRCHRLLGAIADERGDPGTARQHWRHALDTFEQVDAPQDELQTLAMLVETCRDRDDEQARQWCRQATQAIEDAPDSVAERHREWVTDAASALGLS
jgi:PAS domain S-box-containing protein